MDSMQTKTREFIIQDENQMKAVKQAKGLIDTIYLPKDVMSLSTMLPKPQYNYEASRTHFHQTEPSTRAVSKVNKNKTARVPSERSSLPRIGNTNEKEGSIASDETKTIKRARIN